MKIDCHMHLPTFEGLNTFEEKKKQIIKDLKKNHIDYAIIIPDNVEGSPIGSLDDLITLFKDEKQIFLMGAINILNDGEQVFDKLRNLLKKNMIKGIKIFPGHDSHYPNDSRLKEVFEMGVDYNVPLVIHTGWNVGDPEVAKYNDPKYIIEIAEKYKDLKIVICHYFWPEVEYCYNLTNEYSNIYFDISALGDAEVQRITGIDKIIDILEKTISKSSNRVLFGTDYGMCSIEKHIDLVDRLIISQEDKEKILYKNAIEVFNLEV